MYRCDKKFHTQALREQMADHDKYGYVIINGDSLSLHVLEGARTYRLFKDKVDLPNKHNKGGQSQNRYQRIRREKIGWYLSDSAEVARHHFISDNKPNIKGLILAGAAQIKNDLAKILDPQLINIVMAVVDVQYGGQAGLRHALQLTRNLLKGSELVRETEIVEKFMTQIAIGSDIICFGESEMKYAIDIGAVETVLIWNQCNLVEWVKKEAPMRGTKIEVLECQSPIGMQFAKGFSIGGYLRYPIEF